MVYHKSHSGNYHMIPHKEEEEEEEEKEEEEEEEWYSMFSQLLQRLQIHTRVTQEIIT